MTKGQFTQTEISSQPEVWKSILERMKKQQDDLTHKTAGFAEKPLIVTGCGSTYYLSLYAATVLRHTGIQAWAFPASELVLFPQSCFSQGFNLLAISRSGTTSETVWAVDRFRKEQSGGSLSVITCVPDTPLLKQADIYLLAPEAQEKSVAQTRSFTSMALLAQVLTDNLTGDMQRLEHLQRLPAALEDLLRREKAQTERIGADLNIQRFFFLGNGSLYGIACEAMLKTKEMTCSWAEAYHPLEFRHGPMSVAGKDALVIGFISESAAEAEIRVLRDMKSLGSRTLALVEDKSNFDWNGVDQVIELHSGVNEWERGPLYLPLIQLMAYHRSLKKGLDPDRPVNLTAVVNL